MTLADFAIIGILCAAFIGMICLDRYLDER